MNRITAVLFFVLLSVAVGRAEILDRDQLLSLLIPQITAECQRKYEICRQQANFEQNICARVTNAKSCAFTRTVTPEGSDALCSNEVYQRLYDVACMTDDELFKFNSLRTLRREVPAVCVPIIKNCIPDIDKALSLKEVCKALTGSGETCIAGYPGDSKKSCESFYQYGKTTACAGVRGAVYSLALLAGLFLLAVTASLSY